MKNRIETDKQNNRVKKYFRSRIACDKEKEILQLMSTTGMVPQIFSTDSLCIEISFCPGLLISEILKNSDVNFIAEVLKKLAQWLDRFQNIFYEKNGTYIVLEDINPRNFIYNRDTGNIMGIDFEAWHTGDKNENILWLLIMIKTAHFKTEDIKNAVYSQLSDAVEKYFNIKSEFVEKITALSSRTVINRRNAMKFIRNCRGVIIAGGRSGRMGTPKGLLVLDGYTFIDHILYAMQIFDTVSISANIPEYDDFGCNVIRDIHHDTGPLAALYAGLKASKENWVFFTPCDMPFITTATILDMALQADWSADCVVAECGGRVFPTVGFYNRKILPAIKRQIENGNLRMMSLLEKSNVQYVSIHRPDEFVNINTKEDYKEITGEN